MLLRAGAVIAPLLLIAAGGCRSFWHEPRSLPLVAQLDPTWRDAPVDFAPPGHAYVSHRVVTGMGPEAALQSARDAAADARLAEISRSGAATDDHYLAAMASWTALAQMEPGAPQIEAAREAYHASVARLLATARDENRFLPGHGIVVNGTTGPVLIPLVLHGFVWHQLDVQALHPVGEYRVRSLSRQYRGPGWGVPVVVERKSPTGCYAEEDLLTPGAMFAATALVRPCPATGGAILELYDPLHGSRGLAAPLGPLAFDLSAPFALRVVSSPELVRDWLSFFGVDVPSREGLFLLEPYQAGKIPVVLVHGILSNPMAWIDLANDVRAVPGFADHFQIWGFRYSTEAPFLEAASRLRRDLHRVVATVDPAGLDPALRDIVLVGHSMGGLVCELQTASSQHLLWNAVANRPLAAIAASPETRAALANMFYFHPQPNVRRVISIAAPHEGSRWASRPIGQLGALLAEPDPERAARHEQLLADNPGVFSSEITARVPTSVDMLRPDSAVRAAIASLPRRADVRFHTVFGYGRWSLLDGEGDGVVSVQSAFSPYAASQVGVEASHSKIHRQLETAYEVVRILNEHLAEYAARSGGMAHAGANLLADWRELESQ
jgi:hypothetical protein